VHERFTGDEIRTFKRQHPDLTVLAHPECPRTCWASDYVGSTAGMVRTSGGPAVAGRPRDRVLDGRQRGVEFPATEFVRPCNLCPHMKRITLPKILHALQSMEHRVEVEPAVAERARRAVERMLAVGRGAGR
jgi:quinolinate synthase